MELNEREGHELVATRGVETTASAVHGRERSRTEGTSGSSVPRLLCHRDDASNRKALPLGWREPLATKAIGRRVDETDHQREEPAVASALRANLMPPLSGSRDSQALSPARLITASASGWIQEEISAS
jgi:hypothetical protein